MNNEITHLSDGLPARPALEGRVLGAEPTPGKYGHAVIAGIQFGVTRIELDMGAVIFECTLMRTLDYTFTVRPGAPVRIYGTDGRIVVDHEVPGVSGSHTECVVAPGETATVFLPYRMFDFQNARPDEQTVFDNQMTMY